MSHKHGVLTPTRIDPSKTIRVRRLYSQQMANRFKKISNAIYQQLVVNDALGVKESLRLLVGNAGLSRNAVAEPGEVGRWRFHTDADKITAFQDWLKEQISTNLLSVDRAKQPWLAEYVNSAYKQGMLRSHAESNKNAKSTQPAWYTGAKDQFLSSAFNAPETVSKLKLLSTRNYEQLKGVTSAMSGQMSHTLASGIVNGDGPAKIARELRKRLDINSNKAQTIARTETIYAHAEGQLDGYEKLGVETVLILAEWSTAGDLRVCELCSPLEGMVMSIAEARGLIPRHPNCRCAWSPVVDKKPSKKANKAKLEASIRAEKLKVDDDGKQKESQWVGAELVSDKPEKVEPKTEPKVEPKVEKPKAKEPKQPKQPRQSAKEIEAKRIADVNQRIADKARIDIEREAQAKAAAKLAEAKRVSEVDKERAIKAGNKYQFKSPLGNAIQHGHVEPKFRKLVNETLGLVDPKVAAQIEHEGNVLHIGERSTVVDPTLIGKRLRGWPPDATWDNAEGFYANGSRRIVVTERKISRLTGELETASERRIKGVILHETGHSWDGPENKYSTNPEFIDAYNLDVAAMSQDTKSVNGYFLQGGNDGRDEVIAEGFATAHGFNAGQNIERFERSFPNAMKFIRSQLVKIAKGS